ncbi:MAG: hypothetical protein AB1630_05540 [bacterium]
MKLHKIEKLFMNNPNWLGGLGLGLILQSILESKFLFWIGVVFLAFDAVSHIINWLAARKY